MNEGKTVFSQIMEFLPMYEFRKCVERYQGDYKVLSFSCLDQFLCMAFAQLTFRESAGYPGLLALKAKQTVSHGHPRKSIAQYFVECQQSARVAYLCRLCDDLNPQGANFISTIPLALIWATRFMPWIQQPSIYVCPFFHGHVFEKARVPSNFIHFWICVDQSRHLSILPTEKSRM